MAKRASVKTSPTKLKISNPQQAASFRKILEEISSEQSFEGALQAVTEEIYSATKFSGVAVELHDESSDAITVKSFSGIERISGDPIFRVPASEAISFEAIRSGARTTEENLSMRTGAYAEFWKARRFGWLSCFPLASGNTRFQGTLTLLHCAAVHPDDVLVQWLRSVALLLGTFCDAHFASESEKRYRSLEIKFQDVESKAGVIVREAEERALSKIKEMEIATALQIREANARARVTEQKAAHQVQEIQEKRSRELDEVRRKAKEDMEALIESHSAAPKPESLWDDATGLPNKTLFSYLLSRDLAQARRRKELVAVMFFEINRFREREIAEVADILTRQVIQRLLPIMREGDAVIRLGGGRFLWSVSGLHEPEDITMIAQKMLTSVSVPFDLEGKHLAITGNIGVSVFPTDGLDAETLIAKAETALRQPGSMTASSYRFSSAELNERIRAQFLFKRQLQEAASKQEICLHYQPIVGMDAGELKGIEALIRWKKPDGRLALPQEFLGLAENTGMSARLDEWVLRSACIEKNLWQKEGFGSLRISVNLSSQSFWQMDKDRLSEILRELGTRPDSLEFEISESIILRDIEKSISLMEQIRGLGVRLTVDDFGTGGGSLTSLKQYPVHTLKIDPSLLRGISPASSNAPVVTAIISFAHSLNIQVVAEAVETPDEVEFLRSLQCDGFQGKRHSPPLAREHFREYLRKRQTKPAIAAGAQERVDPQDPSVNSELPKRRVSEITQKIPEEYSAVEANQVPPYMIQCSNCQSTYDAIKVPWCSCLTSDPTLVCPNCAKCFCKAALAYRHKVWDEAPDALWEYKNVYGSTQTALPENTPVALIKHPLVLVVDDETQVLRTASRLIRGLGYAVVVARDGEEGIKLAKAYMPEVILSDALMPKLDGREMCRLLKEDSQTAKIKSIIMTAFTGVSKYKSTILKEIECDEQIQKPVEFDRLRSILQKMIS